MIQLSEKLSYANSLADFQEKFLEVRKSKEEETKEIDYSVYTCESDKIAEWIQTHYYIPETKSPMELYPSQEIPLREALSTDENGLFKYSTVVWGSIKKSAKSSIAAAVALWFAWRNPWSSIRVIANDLKQAESRVYYYARRAITLHPEWRGLVKIHNYKMIFPNHSTIEAIPIDPTGEAGGGDDLVIYSEIWAWKNQAALKLWTESTLSPLKYGKSLRWCETYSGFVGESPILEQLYESGVKQGKAINEEYEMYSNQNARIFALWNTKPRLPWQSKEYYAQEESTLTDPEFRRVHKNEWVTSTSAFVPLEWWSACKKPIPPLEKDQPMIVSLDAAISGDSFGIVGITGRDDGENYDVRYARCWYPPKNGKIDYQGTEENPGPEREVRRLIDTYAIVELVYDPFQLEDMMNRIRRELIVHVFPFPQGNDRLISDKQLQELIKNKKIAHSGEVDLSEHVQNANAKTEGERLRIVKRAEHLKIDLCVCLSMGTERARHWGL